MEDAFTRRTHATTPPGARLGVASGAVVGGVVGGIASVCLVAGVLLFLLHRKRKAMAEAAKAEKEATPVRATCESEAAQNECSFWWVNAKALRESKDVTLPRFQELRKREGFLEKQKITRQSSVQGAYTANYLTISHRWLGGVGQPPDPSGTQLDAIRSYLLANLDIEWVWFDYWCMPQAKRSLAEDIEFKHMLKHANLLYLGTRVLILLDLSYIGRFWTLFEAWLSMQAAHPEGLTPATREQQRFDIVPIHGANRLTGESLKSMGAEKTPKEAYDLLKEPDVTVTNQGDKDIQLEKLLQLDKEVFKAMSYGAPISQRNGPWSLHEA